MNDVSAEDAIAADQDFSVNDDYFTTGLANDTPRMGPDADQNGNVDEDNDATDLPQANEKQSKLAWIGALMATFVLGTWRLFRKRKDED